MKTSVYWVLAASLLVGCGASDSSIPAKKPLTAEIAITVSPTKATLKPGEAKAFSAKVEGTEDKEVVWTVQEGAKGGTIDKKGQYTAPEEVGTFHVVAALRNRQRRR